MEPKHLRELFNLSWEAKPEDEALEEVRYWLRQQPVIPGWELPPENEESILQLIAGLLLRGVASVYKTAAPHDFDLVIQARVDRLGRGVVEEIQEWAGTHPKMEAWTTFLACQSSEATDLVKYLVPTFMLTTWRPAKVIDFSNLVQLCYSSVMDEHTMQQLKEVEQSRLLVVEDVDVRHSLYKRVAGQINSIMKNRGRTWRSTLFIIPVSGPKVSKAVGEGLSYQDVLSILGDVGLKASDPLTRYVAGGETDMKYIGYSEGIMRRIVKKIVFE